MSLSPDPARPRRRRDEAAPADAVKFARLGRPRRVWAIGAVHGEAERLAALHDHIARHFQPGDRLVYLGNLLGRQPGVRQTLDEILDFRRELLARPGMLADDVVFLRGAQEEMWQKLLQLQFAPNPPEVLRWMLSQGVEATLAAYGGRSEEGMTAARDGALQLSRWTNRLRDAIRAAAGHDALYAALRRAAFTADHGLLLVSAGLDPLRPLGDQGDQFWWGGGDFALSEPYQGFRRVVRGFDPAGGGIDVTPLTASLDGGCGRGGVLVAGLFGPDGEVLELIEA